ncbi:sigma-E factor negative regulatory protein [Sulfuriferula nivalis]|uniref:Sigma-E factor negative regulatory protein n=1 Tax=Sulfuriferula nivalis TaxID=2675298 RepID=A0A809SD04_9PROT|nr:sigma-E factor negative regulatory protein [Sulfuriferula nivalis]BBP00237.1 sigma-E factor negative regulatory protein [Sulfuriferula nivalis]
MQNTAKLDSTGAAEQSDITSAAIDGELDSAQFDTFLRDYKRDNDLESQWQTYHLIGDALRQTPMHASSIAQRVSAQLANEPTLLAPQRKSLVHKYALPVAASVAAVMLVSWSALNLTSDPIHSSTLAANTPSAQQPVIQTAQIDPTQLNEFIAAHRDYSAGVNSPFVNASYEIPAERNR